MRIFKLVPLMLCLVGVNHPVLANNQEKINLVKKVYETFDAENSDEWIDYLGTTSLKNSLKKRDSYQEWFNKKYKGEMSSCIESSHPPYPGNGGIERGKDLSLKYSESADGMIIAQLKMDNENDNYHTEDFVAYKIILEGGQYKIDDVSAYWYEKDKAKWQLGTGFKNYVDEYCKLGTVN